MKIIYEFDPYEDQEELKMFQKARDNLNRLYNIETYIRQLYKYDERDTIEIAELREKIYEILGDYSD